MNMQQMMAQAQKMQRELQKAQAELQAKEFTVSKAGVVEVTMKGNKTIVSINIDKEALSADMKDMVEDTIKMAINELIEQITTAEAQINEAITGRAGGLF